MQPRTPHPTTSSRRGPPPRTAARARSLALLGLVVASLPGCAERMFLPGGPPPAPTSAGATAGGRTGTDPTAVGAFEAVDLPVTLRRPYQDLRRHTSRTIGEDTGIDVSPGGGAILYSSTQDSRFPKLYLKEKDSALIRSLTNGSFRDIHPKFSPDGDWVAFASDREGNFDIWMLSLANPGVSEQVTASPEDEVHPSFSPDGKRIAFCRRSLSHGWTLWIQHLDRHSVVELGPGLFPEWSPTGEWIAFQKARDHGERWYGVWVVRPDGTEVRQVAAFDNWGAIQPTWSPTAEMMAFTTVSGRGDSPDWDGTRALGEDIAIIDLRSGRLFQLTHHEGSNWSPSWGLDGRIYFTSDRYGGRNLLSLEPPEVRDP